MKSKFLDLLIKLILLIAVGLVFYYQILAKANIDEILVLFLERRQSSSSWPLIFALLLVPVNWGLETKKWQSLLTTFYQTSFFQTYKAVLAGITVSLITPNRVGEYGGRVVFLPDGYRWHGTVSTLVGSFAQLIALLTFGLIALFGLTLGQFEITNLILAAYFMLSGLLITLLFLLYFNLPIVVKTVRKLPYWNKWKKYFSPLKAIQKFPSIQLRKALIFACLRYLLYFFQYFLLASYFGIEIGLLDSFLVIGTIFLVQTSIPLPPIWSLLVRGQAALYFWGLFEANPIAILASTFALWVINLILPSLFGLLLLMSTNIPKTLGYEEK